MTPPPAKAASPWPHAALTLASLVTLLLTLLVFPTSLNPGPSISKVS